MASLLQPVDDETNPLNTAVTSTSGGDAGTGGTATTATPVATPATIPPPSVNTQPSSQNDIAAITGANQNVDFAPLTNYVSNEGQAARNAINSANNNFNTTLGNFSQFGDDQKAQLSGVLNGTKPIDVGKSMLSNTYTPTAINNASYDPLTQQYTNDAGQIGSASGISNLLGTIRPDLTPGERSYDATVYGGEPAYQKAVQDIRNDANSVNDLGSTTTANAAKATSQRANDVNAFNTAASGYVQSESDAINQAIANQIAAANANDTGVQSELGQLQGDKLSFTDVPANTLGFDPTAYKPTTLTSQYGADAFAPQTIDPNQFLSYQQGQLATRNNVASADQARQYNNAQALLQGNDTLTPGTRQGAQININQAALQQALQSAINQRNAADAAWLKAHPPATPDPTPVPVAPVVMTEGVGDGSGAGGDSGGGGADAGGGDAAGEFKGGFVKPSAPRASNPLNKLRPASDTALQAQAAPQNPMQDNPAMMAALNKTLLQRQPVISNNATPTASDPTGFYKGGQIDAHIGRVNGGYVPQNTGKPNARDDISTNVTNGEFVTRQPSVAAIGANNLIALNKMNSASPHDQMLVRNALQTALNRAHLGSAR